MAQKTIVMLIDELQAWAGTEIQLLRLLQTIDRGRWRPIVAVIGRSELAGEFLRQGVPTHPLGIYRTLAPSGLVGVSRIASLIREEQAALLLTYHTSADLLGPLAGKLAGVPTLSCRRDEGFTKKAIHIALQRGINPFLTGIITVSHAVADAVIRSEGFSREKIQVIWNGEDLVRFSPGEGQLRQELHLGPGALLACSVGSLTAVKDHQTQLQALRELLPTHPELHLVLAGDGPERPALEQLAAPLSGHVHFLGRRPDVVNVLRSSDLYLQTSLTEGFSNAIVQAMATALPVVATRVGGNPELVLPETGLLVPARDPATLILALETLAANPQLRRSLGQAGRARMETYARLDTMAQAYLDAFDRAVEQRFPGSSSGVSPEQLWTPLPPRWSSPLGQDLLTSGQQP